MAEVIAGPVAQHVGKECVLTSAARYTYADVARAFSEQLGEPVTHVDDDAVMCEAFGEMFDTVMTYCWDDSPYEGVPHRETVLQLLGRPQQTLDDYIAARLENYR